MSRDPLALATDEQSEYYVSKAREWLQTSPSSFMFNSSKNVTICAIAEFLANQDRLTLYKHVINEIN